MCGGSAQCVVNGYGCLGEFQAQTIIAEVQKAFPGDRLPYIFTNHDLCVVVVASSHTKLLGLQLRLFSCHYLVQTVARNHEHYVREPLQW